jgi:hypothetical protein
MLPIEPGDAGCEDAAWDGQGRRTSLLGRMCQNMEDTHVKASSEIQPKDTPVQGERSKSRFDDAEYERWSEKLRSRSNSKGK